MEIKGKPKRSKADFALTVAKAGISGIPYIGGPAAEIFSQIIVPPLSKRRDEWLESIGEGLKRLEEKIEGFKIEELANNETFITTVTHASQAAIRNHQNEKLKALRNAVLNAALPNAPKEDFQLMFLNYVDSLQTWHLAILEFLDNPIEWGKRQGITYPTWGGGGANVALEYAFDNLRAKRDIYDVFVRDLYSRGLLSTDNLHVSGTGDSILASRSTALGRQFLEFITSPLDDEE